MTALRIIDNHLELASIGTKTHVQIESHIQGIGNYAFPAADGGADQVLKTNGAGVLAWIDKNHSIASHNDTAATGAQLDTLVDNSIADALHRHSKLVASDGSPDPCLSCTAGGNIDIERAQVAPITVKIRNTSGKAMLNIGQGASNNFELSWFYNAVAANAYGKVVTYGYTNDLHIDGKDLLLQAHNTSGRIGMGTLTPATSAKLELSSTTGALLLTRMTTAQRNALTAINGMLLYNSTLNKFQGYENGAWTSLI